MAVTVIRQWERERANEEDNEEVLILVTVVPIIPNIIKAGGYPRVAAGVRKGRTT